MSTDVLAEELLAAIGLVRRHLRRSAGRPWPESPLTGSQVELVRPLRRRPGISVAEAAAALGLAANTVSTLVRQLTDAGLVVRVPDESDRRVARLALTDDARAQVERWRDRRNIEVAAAFDGLSAEDRKAIESAVPASPASPEPSPGSGRAERSGRSPDDVSQGADRRTTAAVPRRAGTVARDLLVRGPSAVKDLSLVIEAGECFGLLGPNGAGKTTTIRLLNTLLPLQEGTSSIFGYDVHTHAMAVRRLLGYVPQQLSIEGALTARENVSWFARLYDVPRSERRRRVDEVLEIVDLTDVADRVASSFSGGMVRRLELAQALVNRPSLLVLDEPTVGLDPVARDSVWTRVTEMQKQYGMTVLLTTHYMEEAEALCDRVALMHRANCGRSVRPVGARRRTRARRDPRRRLPPLHR